MRDPNGKSIIVYLLLDDRACDIGDGFIDPSSFLPLGPLSRASSLLARLYRLTSTTSRLLDSSLRLHDPSSLRCLGSGSRRRSGVLQPCEYRFGECAGEEEPDEMRYGGCAIAQAEIVLHEPCPGREDALARPSFT